MHQRSRPWLAARPVRRAASPHTRPEIGNPSYRADARSVSGSTPPANEGDVARVGGLDRRHVAGRNRSTFPGAWDEANVRYPPLIGHTATASELDFGHFRPADPVGRGRSFVSDIV